ncbi:RING-type E3 ubiquitin transferase [Trifolium repens]|nr:RING-type E3 ubiquitin transferase [Trifolium repens]
MLEPLIAPKNPKSTQNQPNRHKKHLFNNSKHKSGLRTRIICSVTHSQEFFFLLLLFCSVSFFLLLLFCSIEFLRLFYSFQVLKLGLPSCTLKSSSEAVLEGVAAGFKGAQENARGLKKHLKRLNAPKHWMLDKLGGAFMMGVSMLSLKME